MHLDGGEGGEGGGGGGGGEGGGGEGGEGGGGGRGRFTVVVDGDEDFQVRASDPYPNSSPSPNPKPNPHPNPKPKPRPNSNSDPNATQEEYGQAEEGKEWRYAPRSGGGGGGGGGGGHGGGGGRQGRRVHEWMPLSLVRPMPPLPPTGCLEAAAEGSIVQVVRDAHLAPTLALALA